MCITYVCGPKNLYCWIRTFIYFRVGNKFSDTFNELFSVNWLISIFFSESTKSSPYHLKILIKSTKIGLSYRLKRDQRSISKMKFVPCFLLALLMQNLENFSQKLLFVIQISIILTWIRPDGWKYSYVTKKIQIWIKRCSFCEKFSKFCINRANTRQGTNMIIEIDFWSCLRL